MSLYRETLRKLESLKKRRAEIEKEMSESKTQESGARTQALSETGQESLTQSSFHALSIAEQPQIHALSKPSEQQVIKELLFAFQGITGSMLSKNELVRDHLRFRMTAEVGDSTLRQQVLHLAVLGTMYDKVNSFVELQSLQGESLFLSALASALRVQLHSFLGLLAHLECKLASQKMTLIQLRVETLIAKKHLSWLVTVTEASKFQAGCNVMSTLHTLMLTLSGNPQAFKSVSATFLSVSKVFYQLLKEWLLCARLMSDPFGEFFIATNPHLRASALNSGCFQLRTLMCPSFLSKAQINRIMTAGRNYALLKKILGEKQPLQDIHAKLDRNIEKVITNADHGLNAWEMDGAMHTLMIEIERKISQKLADTLLRHGKLYVHLEILTGFFLLRQSGFAAQLIMKVFDMLSVAAPLVSEFTLREQLRLAISNTTSPEQEDVDLEKRFQFHFKPQPEHDLGWDSFSVTYELEEDNPAVLVVTKEVLEKYYFCFREILQLRRMEWMLCDILKSIKTTYRKLHQLTGEERVVLNHMHLLAKEMHVLIQQVLNSILQVRLQANWHHFCEKIKSIASIENMRDLHQKYLTSIKVCLFTEQMHEMLDLTIELNDLFKSFMLAFKFPPTAQRNSKDEDDYASCFKRGTTTPSKTVFSPSSVPERLAKLRSDFYLLVMNFLLVVKQRPEEDMQNLYEFINLNNFYQV